MRLKNLKTDLYFIIAEIIMLTKDKKIWRHSQKKNELIGCKLLCKNNRLEDKKCEGNKLPSHFLYNTKVNQLKTMVQVAF